MKRFIMSVTVLSILLSNQIYANEIRVDGQKVNANVEINDGKAVVSVRGLLEAMNYNVEWDSETKNITASSNVDDVNVIYSGMSDDEVNQLKASMNEILEKNQFGLVYDGAITENVDGQVNIRPVSYKNQQGIRIAANLYLPPNYDDKKSYPAVVVAHPNGGVKEQVSGLFA